MPTSVLPVAVAPSSTTSVLPPLFVVAIRVVSLEVVVVAHRLLENRPVSRGCLRIELVGRLPRWPATDWGSFCPHRPLPCRSPPDSRPGLPEGRSGRSAGRASGAGCPRAGFRTSCTGRRKSPIPSRRHRHACIRVVCSTRGRPRRTMIPVFSRIAGQLQMKSVQFLQRRLVRHLVVAQEAVVLVAEHSQF